MRHDIVEIMAVVPRAKKTSCSVLNGREQEELLNDVVILLLKNKN